MSQAPIAERQATHGVLSQENIDSFSRQFRSEPSRVQAMNAVASADLLKVATNRTRAANPDHTYSVHLEENLATSQKNTGRCWMFAALNIFRPTVISALNVETDFELSQSYTMFWDKLEKANYFLENILSTLDEPVGSRIIDHLLSDPVQDGGQWHMFVGLVQKYGVVPKSVMNESVSSSASRHMNSMVTGKLREFACELRRSHERHGAKTETLRSRKEEMMAHIYSMLCIHLGEPPRDFNWQWRDKERDFHRAGRITPQEFYKRYVSIDLEDYVCLIHDPRPDHEFNRSYTIQALGNVQGGPPVVYLNVELDVMKRAAIKQMQDGSPVWFGCDVGKYLDRKAGIMDPDWFDFSLVYGEDIALDKAERLMYGQSLMTHAMVFTGVDLDVEDRPTKWRVENSWSEDAGQKGFFQMSDAWFDEFNYEAVVHRSYVPEQTLRALEEEPVVLPPWDPMGSLAI